MTAGLPEADHLVASIWTQLSGKDTFWIADAQRRLDTAAFLDLALAYAVAVREGDAFGNAAVPVLVGRRIESVAAILGTLLAGRAFAPLSYDQPWDRIAGCLASLGASAVLSGLGTDEQRGEVNARLVIPDSSHRHQGHPPRLDGASEDLLYILFTSGSTGAPKGVMCNSLNILNTLIWSEDCLDWQESDVIGVVSRFSFDIAMFDVFTALYRGVPLVIFDKPNDPLACLAEIEHSRITSLFTVPFFFSQFLSAPLLARLERSRLRRILSGGDFFPPAHILAWRLAAPSVRVLNVWGPTETSIVNTMHEVGDADIPNLKQGKSAPVGTSHSRMEVVLLDPDNPVATPTTEASGEIALLGDCVSMGYFADADLTSTSFFELDGKRGFRTADLGYFEDGQLYISGRTGNRVKIAGHRVDLSEVESALAQAPFVRQGTAFVHETVPDIPEIWCAVRTQNPETRLDVFALKTDLRNRLPRYMVPKRIVEVDEMPLNANGKVDRKALKRLVLEKP